jgi:transposase
VEYWLNAKPDDPVAFAAEVAAVCEAYQHAPAVAQPGGHIISTDEKPGIQALERAAPTLPMKPGLVERPEYEYLGHGTQGLIANVDVATGRVLAPTLGPSRTEEDCAGHSAQTIATDPAALGIFIVDPLNIHKSAALVRLVARACGITEELGEKEKRGILQSMQTRAAVVSDASHRSRFLYTPKHTSWLNHLELWFSIVVRRLLKRGNFTSVADLRERILAFITYFNKTMAKPFKWTYKGRPLTV